MRLRSAESVRLLRIDTSTCACSVTFPEAHACKGTSHHQHSMDGISAASRWQILRLSICRTAPLRLGWVIYVRPISTIPPVRISRKTGKRQKPPQNQGISCLAAGDWGLRSSRRFDGKSKMERDLSMCTFPIRRCKGGAAEDAIHFRLSVPTHCIASRQRGSLL